MKALYPDLADPASLVRDGFVLVDGLPVRNPGSLIRSEASIRLAGRQFLRGEVKLGAALERFGVAVAGTIALDVGAAAGGFTRALLDAGALRVYAVDAGHGQLLGSLRQDERVVNLEATNLALLDRGRVPEAVGIVTVDVSYLAVARAVPQLDRVELTPGADLVALVKPMFELGLASAPSDPALLEDAVRRAAEGVEAAGWRRVGTMESPVRGARGAVEFFLHARRDAAEDCAPPSRVEDVAREKGRESAKR